MLESPHVLAVLATAPAAAAAAATAPTAAAAPSPPPASTGVPGAVAASTTPELWHSTSPVQLHAGPHSDVDAKQNRALAQLQVKLLGSHGLPAK